MKGTLKRNLGANNFIYLFEKDKIISTYLILCKTKIWDILRGPFWGDNEKKKVKFENCTKWALHKISLVHHEI